MNKLLILSAFLVSSYASAAVAQTSRNCGPRDLIVERLTNEFNEKRQSVGLAANNSMVETFASIESGSWTIVMTMPNGLSCLVASGENYENVNEPSVPKGDKL